MVDNKAIPATSKMVFHMPHDSTSLPDFKPVEQTEDLTRLLMEARTQVVLGSSIYAYTMMRCEYIFTRDLPYKTAASCVHDDRNIVFFDPDFFREELANKKQRAFVLLHELDHIFFHHQEHCIEMSYDHKTFNRAADFYINLSLSGVYLDGNGLRKTNPRYTSYFERPSCGLYDEFFLGWGSDKIYEYLIKNPKNKANSSEQFDIFLGNGGSKQQKMRNIQTASAALVAAQQSNSIGENEGDLVRRITELSKPVVDWQSKVTALVQSSTKIRPTYNKVSRRSSTDGGDGVIFPVYNGNKIKVFFGFDSSGSMGPSDYKVVASELQGILTQFDAWDLDLVSCDVACSWVGSFSSEDGDSFDDIEITFTGGGGTLMGKLPEEAYRVSDETGEMYDVIIVVTDGRVEVNNLDESFESSTTNIVITTQIPLELKNAESISITPSTP
jgi:predicted metal-dependent peptidase